MEETVKISLDKYLKLKKELEELKEFKLKIEEGYVHTNVNTIRYFKNNDLITYRFFTKDEIIKKYNSQLSRNIEYLEKEKRDFNRKFSDYKNKLNIRTQEETQERWNKKLNEFLEMDWFEFKRWKKHFRKKQNMTKVIKS